ncbi:MAG: hypothetical protein K2J77_04105 [Oscillospiraceae bacterium]|nr:hypothetical protein [Oscillospiraceae bacterium]
MIEWTWVENSVLYNDSPYVPPREIFQAACDELGRYFTQNGAKYTKSNRKIKWNLGAARLEAAFWSSHSNIAGEWVNLEIVSSIYAVDKNDLDKKGYIYADIRPQSYNVYKIDNAKFTEIIEYLNGILETARLFNSKAGIRQFLAERSVTEAKFLNKHPNNHAFFERLPEVQPQ